MLELMNMGIHRDLAAARSQELICGNLSSNVFFFTVLNISALKIIFFCKPAKEEEDSCVLSLELQLLGHANRHKHIHTRVQHSYMLILDALDHGVRENTTATKVIQNTTFQQSSSPDP